MELDHIEFIWDFLRFYTRRSLVLKDVDLKVIGELRLHFQINGKCG